MNKQHINAAGLSIIKRFEGLKLVAYADACGVWVEVGRSNV